MNAEHEVLGCVLRDNTVYATAAEIITGDDFTSPTLGAIFDGIGRALESGRMLEAYTLQNHYPEWQVRGVGLDEPGRWLDLGLYPEMIEEAARTVRTNATRRRGREALTAALDDLQDAGRDPDQVLQRVTEAIGATINQRGTQRAPAYIDVAAMLDGSLAAPQTAAGGRRSDGLPLLYLAAVNVLLGAPEAGKTLIAGAMAADELFSGGSVLWIDLDHNGAPAILNRLHDYGVSHDLLADRDRFRLAIAENADDIQRVVGDAKAWAPTLAVVDSIGELLPMFGAKSNDADDYTDVHRKILTALAAVGTAVLAIDHEAKGVESRNYGAGGTMAKKRAVDGALLRVTATKQFAPGAGGEAHLSIVKDRHGALRMNAHGSREPIITTFTLVQLEDGLDYRFTTPTRPVEIDQPLADVDELLKLVPPPGSVRDVRDRMKWGATRATNALRAYRNSIGETPRGAYLEEAD
ncbi:DnaB-like helicase N-terminal domain-containing protein [Microbacterium sp. A204]|uniref:DnaB-like helicase N-terminal domain-containing protein n=1 Tax=Microbacterium sp. A204 TaxID=3457321 RepID=UPI003FCF5F1F